jgi:hypothetical protein
LGLPGLSDVDVFQHSAGSLIERLEASCQVLQQRLETPFGTPVCLAVPLATESSTYADLANLFPAPVPHAVKVLPADTCLVLAKHLYGAPPAGDVIVVIDCSDNACTLSLLSVENHNGVPHCTRILVHQSALPRSVADAVLDKAMDDLQAHGWSDVRSLQFTSQRIAARIIGGCMQLRGVPDASLLHFVHPISAELVSCDLQLYLSTAGSIVHDEVAALIERAHHFLDRRHRTVGEVLLTGRWPGAVDIAALSRPAAPVWLAPQDAVGRGAAIAATLSVEIIGRWMLVPDITELPEHPLQALARAIREEDEERIMALGLQVLGRESLPADMLARVVLARQRSTLEATLDSANTDEALVTLWDGGYRLHSDALRSRWEAVVAAARTRLRVCATMRMAIQFQQTQKVADYAANDELDVCALLSPEDRATMEALLADVVDAPSSELSRSAAAQERLVVALDQPADSFTIAAVFREWQNESGIPPEGIDEDRLDQLERRIDAADAVRQALAMGDAQALQAAWLPSILRGEGGLTPEEEHDGRAMLLRLAEERLLQRTQLMLS